MKVLLSTSSKTSLSMMDMLVQTGLETGKGWCKRSATERLYISSRRVWLVGGSRRSCDSGRKSVPATGSEASDKPAP